MMSIYDEFSDQQIANVDELIETYGKKEGGLIPLLEKVQGVLGYVPESVQNRISEKTHIPPNRIIGVLTFYSFFATKPRARHRIQLCMGTACYVKGAAETAKKLAENYNLHFGESSADGRFTLEKARCLGACGLAPVIVIDGKVYGKATVDKLDEILSHYE